MPSKAELFDLASELKLPTKSKMTKKDLIALVGEERAKAIDYATHPRDLPDKRGILVDGKAYDKVWEKAEPKFHAAVARHGNKLVLIKGELRGNGLGMGGAKWSYSQAALP